MTGKPKFKKLLEPFHIGRVQTRNRIVKTAADMAYTDESGIVTEKFKAFYDVLSKGGVGLIIVESPTIEDPRIKFPSAKDAPKQLRLDDDKYIQGFHELTDIIHKNGCPTFIQLYHHGAWDVFFKNPVVGFFASTMPQNELPGADFVVPRELTIAEIGEMVDKFAKTAERAQKAGFDGVEINGSSCHLINSFLSRFWNRRQDAYGYGSLENRARFGVEILREVRKRVGPDFPVGIFINGAEYGLDKGMTIEEAQEFAKIFEGAGADVIHIRAYGYLDYSFGSWPDQIFFPEPPRPLPRELGEHHGEGGFVRLGEAIKKVVSIPVIIVGRIDPAMGEKILQQGKADFIGMNRRLIADPELPNKLAAGRLEDIAPCTACMHCASAVASCQPEVCRVNAALGSEWEYTIEPAEKRKRVVVVGGGPAGMEAARVAALRGHEVILYERERKLGGLTPLAALVKGLEIEDLPALLRYLKTQITKLGVKIKLGKEFKPLVIEEIKPDVVVIATGGLHTIPKIPGINGRNVLTSLDLDRKVMIYLKLLGPKVVGWLSRIWMPIGKRAVIIGGSIQGYELAEFLVKRGRKVTIVDTAEKLGETVPYLNRMMLIPWLAEKGVTMIAGAKYEEITDKGLTIVTREGKRQTIEADTILPEMAPSPNTELLEKLDGKVSEVYHIGESKQPVLIIDAIADGWRTGRAI